MGGLDIGLQKTLRFVLSHPLNRGHRLRALNRFLSWQLRSRLASGPITMPFFDDAVLNVRRGMTGATGNIYCGLHEFEDMAFTLHLLRCGDVFADIGANVGSYTVLAGRGCGAEVIAVEPVAATFEALRDNVLVNNIEGHVHLHRCGVGSGPAVANFAIDQDTTNHVVESGDAAVQEMSSVELKPLDDLCRHRWPMLVKLDVEGYEYPALEGAKRILASGETKALIVELNGSGVRYGYSDTGLHALITDYGFFRIHTSRSHALYKPGPCQLLLVILCI